jgi:hypothetical protein
MWVLSSTLLGLVSITGHCVLCSMRPTRCHILHSLGWGPCQALGVPLPLVVAPQGMPRQPCLCVLITRDAQLHRTWWRAVAHMHHLLISYGPPYYGMGSLLHQMLGGCAPWPGWMGRVVFIPYRLHELWPSTIFMLTAARLWQQSILQHRGAVTRCWCDSGGGYPPSSGGGLR